MDFSKANGSTPLRALHFWTLMAMVLADLAITRHAGADPVIALKETQPSIRIENQIAVLADPTQRLTIDEVATAQFDERFTPIPEKYRRPNYTEFGLSDAVYWVRLKVRAADVNALTQNWLLNISNPYFIGRITAHFPKAAAKGSTDNRQWVIQTIDTECPIERERRSFFRLPLVDRKVQTIYLRIESDYYVILNPKISTAKYHVKTEQRAKRMTGLFFSIIVIIGIFNLFVFLWLKDRSSLWQLLFVVSFGYYFLVTARLSTNFSTARFLGPMSFAYLQFIGISAIIITCVLFTRSFLQTKHTTPRLHRLLTGYFWLNIAVTLALPLVELDYDIGLVVAQVLIALFPLLIPFVTIIPGIVRLKQGFRPAKLYLVAWGIFAMGAFIFALPFDVPHAWLIFKIGCSANITLLAFAIVHRHRALQMEKVVLAKARDTADAKRTETEERFRTLANSTSARIAIIQDSRIIYANEAFLKHSNLSREELLRTKLTDIFSDRTVEMGLKAWALAEKQHRTQFRYECQEENNCWLEVNARLVELDGKIAFITTSFDITERKLAEQQMFRAEKMASLGQIIAGVAHEINNPNNFIFFNLPILKKYLDAVRPILDESAHRDPNLKILNMPYDMFIDDIYKLLDNMQHGSSRITGIVGDLKDYVRSTDLDDKAPQSIPQLIERVMVLVGKQVQKQVKSFEVDIADGLPEVNMNAGRIEQVLINLVINAGQAADKEESWVRLTAQPCPTDANRIQLTVADNGCGIDENTLPRIFEPFFTTKAEESGTGLGLAISHQIIEDHNGVIQVESATGEGTCFKIQLPVTETNQ